ncbi:MAG: hypothetical protein GX610_15405 [Rhodococcus sp.]|nr:hypothetical protein [Rhodococcus sp. (in: high G+C Gram-positive bacteria)]
MTTGGYDPNNPTGGQAPYGQPPQGNNPPPQGPGGYPPPPQGPGGYPPPPGNNPPGSYPPPPQGAGGYPQGGYPPPPGNYPPPPPFQQPQQGGPGSGQISVGDAVSYAWKKFGENALVWVGISVIALLISVVIQLIFGSSFTADASGDLSFSALGLIGMFVSTIVGYLINAAFIRGALHEIDGNKPAFGSFFQFTNVAAIVIASLIVGVATTIGFFLFLIPGLIVAFLTWFTLPFIIDQNQEPIDAIKSSFNLVKNNAGPLLLLALTFVGLNILGAIPCGLGLFVTIPMTLIGSTYAYRVLTQRYVSAV